MIAQLYCKIVNGVVAMFCQNYHKGSLRNLFYKLFLYEVV
jgi:hypothetical protein